MAKVAKPSSDAPTTEPAPPAADNPPPPPIRQDPLSGAFSSGQNDPQNNDRAKG